MNKGIWLLLAIWLLPAAGFSETSLENLRFRQVSTVQIHADGPVDETFLLNLIEITPGVDILTTSKVRRSIELLYATGNFTNILVDAQEDGSRVALTFILRLVYRFESIHLEGKLGVSARKIRKKMRLRKLEPYTPEKVLQGRDDVLAVLLEEGYYRAHVTPDVELQRSTKRADLVYNVVPGTPAYTETLKFSGDSFYSEDILRKTIRTAPGKRYREYEFQHDLERLEGLFDRNGFLEHKINVVQKRIDDLNRVQIEIEVHSGKQLLLATEGFSLNQDSIQELFPIWVDHSYNDDTLEEGKRNLIVYMQSQGYYDTSVEWKKTMEKERILITYIIQPGTLYELEEIRISGNEHLERNRILDLIKTRESSVFHSGRLVARDLEADIGRILSAYREEGFLFARIKEQEVIRKPQGKLVLDLHIEEGEQVRVAEIRLEGNEVIPSEYFLDHFSQKIGDPVSESRVKNDSNYVVALYSDRGYPKIRLENRLQLSRDKTRAAIVYRIEEGEQVFVDRVVISGNYRTKRGVITENLFFTEDDPLSLRKIQESQSKLYSLEIFDKVDMQLPRPDNLNRYQEILLKLTETKPYTIAYGIGFETYNKLNGVLTLSNRNWLGTARAISLQLRGGFQEGRALLTYNDPHLFNYKVISTFSVFAENRSPRDTFSYRSYGLNFRAEKKLFPERARLEVGSEPPVQKSFFFGYRFEDIDTFGTPSLSPQDRQFLAIHLSAPSASFARDSRDNAIDPTTGIFLSTDLEWSTSLLGSESDYLKSFSWGQYYRPAFGTVIATSLRLGLARGFNKTVRLPISQRFFAGGGRTIRGFDLDTAGPMDADGNPLGGNMLWILNLENRFPLFGNLGGIVFFDWGNVFELIDDFRFSELRETAGLGLRYKTPLGPLAFDWGYKLDRRFKPIRESAYEFYVSIGHLF